MSTPTSSGGTPGAGTSSVGVDAARVDAPHPDPDRSLRVAFSATAPANALVALAMLAPDSWFGRLLGLPLPAPEPVYRGLLALFLLLFAGMYAWLARASIIDRPLVAFAAIGKLLAFVVTSALWLSGAAPGRFALLISGDLVFAVVFFTWLRRTRGLEHG